MGLKLGIKEEIAQNLVQRYGSNVDIIYDLYQRESQAQDETIDPVVLTMLRYAIDYEATYKPTDFLLDVQERYFSIFLGCMNIKMKSCNIWRRSLTGLANRNRNMKPN